MEKLLEGYQISKSYHVLDQKQLILKGIDITINKGDFVSIMGASGSGKSTLLYALSGMDKIDEGIIVFGQDNLTTLSENQLSDLRRMKMGFVFQQPTFLKNLNILDNIILARMKDKRKSKKEILERAEFLMEQMGIENLKMREITQVSGGQLQRAGICRAMMSHPDIIFSDEPTGALNSKSAKEVMDLFSQINQQGTALLIVTHDAHIAARSQRVLFMQDGIISSKLQLPPYQEANHQKRVEEITKQMQLINI